MALSANGIIVLLNSLNSKNLEVRNTSKFERNRTNLMRTDVMLCNTLWSDRRRFITKTFLAFSRTSKRQNLSKLSTNKVFSPFGFIQREILLSGENIFSLATLNAIIYHIRSNQGI